MRRTHSRLLLFAVSVACLGPFAGAQGCITRASALQFDGVDDVVVVGAAGTASPFDLAPGFGGLPSAFTVEAWIKTRFSGGPQPIVAKTGGAAGMQGPVGWQFGLLDDRLYFAQRQLNAPWNIASHTTVPLGLNDGNWHHVAMSWQGGTNMMAEVSVDGVSLSLTAAIGVTPQTTTTPNPLTIGGIPNGAIMGTLGVSFHGVIDEVRIWNRGVSLADLAANRFRRLNGDEPGLIGYWPLDEGGTMSAAAQTVQDSSGTAAHGVRGRLAVVELSDPRWSLTDTALVVAAGGGQPNGAAARLEVNGFGSGLSAGPFVATVPSGGTLDFAWSGEPNQPFHLFGGPLNARHIEGTSFGTVDIGMPVPCVPSLFQDIVTIFSAAGPAGFLFHTDATGQASQSLTIPPGLASNQPLLAVQGLVGTSTGHHLTAAFLLVVE